MFSVQPKTTFKNIFGDAREPNNPLLTQLYLTVILIIVILTPLPHYINVIYCGEKVTSPMTRMRWFSMPNPWSSRYLMVGKYIASLLDSHQWFVQIPVLRYTVHTFIKFNSSFMCICEGRILSISMGLASMWFSLSGVKISTVVWIMFKKDF